MSDFAAAFIDRHPQFVDYVDADEANAQAELLGANGVDILNARVLAAPLGEVLDVVAEHNMAAMLVRRRFTDLQHEPPSMSRPVDLVGMFAGRYYRVEVKRLAASAHDTMQSNVMSTLNAALASRTESVLIQLFLRESFEATDINALVRHVQRSLDQLCTDETYTFGPDKEEIAWYKFRRAANATRPRVAALADVDMRDVTGAEASRIRSKVKRAYDKFKTSTDDGAVHLTPIRNN